MKKTLSAAVALSTALVLAACSDDSSTTEAGTTEVTTVETTTTETAPASAEATTSTVAASGDIVDTAVEAGNFSTLVSAVQAAGLEETLRGDGPFTVFSPTDEAFAALPEGTLDELLAEPEGALTDILTYHVIPSEVLAADVLTMDGQTVQTVQGAELTINVDGDKVSLTDAAGNTVNVTKTDIATTNGVIHVIDGVLMPTAE